MNLPSLPGAFWGSAGPALCQLGPEPASLGVPEGLGQGRGLQGSGEASASLRRDSLQLGPPAQPTGTRLGGHLLLGHKGARPKSKMKTAWPEGSFPKVEW